MINDNRECDCYVRHLDAQTRYVLHNGSHNPSCSWYSVSLDPVDRAHDDDFRARVENPTLREARALIQ